jgi:hypothetical protein
VAIRVGPVHEKRGQGSHTVQAGPCYDILRPVSGVHPDGS